MTPQRATESDFLDLAGWRRSPLETSGDVIVELFYPGGRTEKRRVTADEIKKLEAEVPHL